MMTYSQSSGRFVLDEEEVGDGYSGNGAGMNNPDAQNIKGHGPLPRGQYTVLQASTHPKLGPLAMELLPYSTNQMFLRGDFFIHGDNAELNHTASDGCIILPRVVREQVAAAVARGDNQLTVTA